MSDASKTAKIIKRWYYSKHIDSQMMWWWVISLFMIFAVLDVSLIACRR